MDDLVAKYGGWPVLKKILTEFHTRIGSERGLMHYFFDVPLPQVLLDQQTLMSYIIRKADFHYRELPSQTANRDINIRIQVFEDVLKVLGMVLKDAKVHYKDVPRMVSHIIEVVEETRSSFADIKKMHLKPADIHHEALIKFFQSQGIVSKLDPVSQEIASLHGTGLTYPLYTVLDSAQHRIRFFCRAKARASVSLDAVQRLVTTASERVLPLSFRAYLDEEGSPVFEGRYEVPTQFGVPRRLLQRVSHQFTWRFEEALKVDTDEALINVVAE